MLKVHTYEVEIELSKVPTQGFATSGLRLIHKLPNGYLLSGQYKFYSDRILPNKREKGRLAIIQSSPKLENGLILELLSPVETVGFTKILCSCD